MFAILLLLAYSLVFALLCHYERGLRARALYAASFWGATLFGITEILSLVHLITRPGLIFAWLTVCIGLAIWLLVHRVDARPGPPGPRYSAWGRLPLGCKAAATGTALVLILIAVTAVAAPPNTWDAIYYHMPRIMMWISNRSVGFYPTLDLVQLVYAPWAEYAMLHLAMLAGSDRLVNLVEVSSLIGAAIGASLVAEELGAGIRGQMLAAVTCATIPQAVLEASGAMNSVVVSFWIVAFAFGLLRFSRIGGWLPFLSAAMCFGLAIATKGTAYLILPGVGLACWWLGHSESRRRLLVRLPVFALVMLALNGPLWLRNFALTGSPLGSGFAEGGPRFQQTVGRFSVPGIAANVVRNVALHLTVSEKVDRVGGQIASEIMRFFGADPDDPDFLWHSSPEAPAFDHFRTNAPSRDEVLTGNPLHLLLILIAWLLAFGFRSETDRNVVIYGLGLLGSFLLFSALLRWEPWNARYQLAFFALGAALVGVVIPARLGHTAATALSVVLILAALPYALSNDLRPLLSSQLRSSRFFRDPLAGSIWRSSREDLYFTDLHRNLARSYQNIGSEVLRSGCGDVGIDDSLEQYDYPVMAFLGVAEGRERIRYMGVFNSSLTYATRSSNTCAVICFACARVPEKWSEYRTFGNRVSIFGDGAVFWQSGKFPNREMPEEVAARDKKDLQTVVEISRRQLLALRNLSSSSMGHLWSLHEQARSAHPQALPALDDRIDAVEQPVENASRVWELTAPLRGRATRGECGADCEPLRAADRALTNFNVDFSNAAAGLVRFVDDLSIRR